MILLPKNWPAWVNTLSNEQVQPAGVDLTVKKISRFKTEGILSVDNNDRVISEVDDLKIINSFFSLTPGAYMVRYNEEIQIPENTIGLVFPRSSLMRMGATIHTAVWDPGYKGKGISLLTVYNNLKIQVNSRISQLILIKTEDTPNTLYNGIYQNEK